MSRPRTIRQSIAAIGDGARPEFAYLAPRTMVVRNGRTDGKLDLDPPPDAQHLRPLAAVPVWSLAGSAVRALPGDRVVVIFRDADETRATVIAFEPLPTGRHPVVSIDADEVDLGLGAGLVHLGSGTSTLAIGAEVTGRRVVCYGDNITVPVSGAAAVGPIIQNPLTAPNPIAKVRT